MSLKHFLEEISGTNHHNLSVSCRFSWIWSLIYEATLWKHKGKCRNKKHLMIYNDVFLRSGGLITKNEVAKRLKQKWKLLGHTAHIYPFNEWQTCTPPQAGQGRDTDHMVSVTSDCARLSLLKTLPYLQTLKTSNKPKYRTVISIHQRQKGLTFDLEVIDWYHLTTPRLFCYLLK